MESLDQFDEFPMEIPLEYNPEPTNHLEGQQIQTSRQFESHTSDCGRMPHIPTSSTYRSNPMGWINPYESPEAELERLINEWNEPQMPFSHDWGEAETAYGELNPDMTQPDIYLLSQMSWPTVNLQNDGMFDSIDSQTLFPESYDCTTGFAATWNYPTPLSIAPSTGSDQYSHHYKPDAMPETSPSSAQRSRNALYICEICSRTYPKQHLLK
jgi:hypothetical protein